jgi:very-short-patch-repair endonuclease
MRRLPPHPDASPGKAKRRPSPTRREGKAVPSRKRPSDVKESLKRSLSTACNVLNASQGPQPNPSPLVGEGGERLRRSPGEGASSTAVVRARSLRRSMTDAERKLWYMLRDRRFSDAKFRRQVPLGPYVADFLSFERHIVVEVDGGQHSGKASDVARDDWFRGQGFTVVRFWNNDVLKNLEGVATLLLDIVAANTPHPALRPRAAAKPPSPTRGEGKRSAR